MTDADDAIAYRDVAISLDYGLVLEAVGLEADPWMLEFLRGDHARVILCCGRQVGKTTAAAALCACIALHRPPSLSLLISPSERTSKELMGHVRWFLERLGTESTAAEKDSALQLALANKSRVVALPGTETAARGWSPDLIVLDEAARIDPATFAALRPALAATGGKLVLMSTPHTMTDPFAEVWHGAGEWRRIHLRSADCARISADFLAEERRTMPAWQYAQEYDAAFARNVENAVFPAHLVERAISDDVEPLRANWPSWAA